MENQTITLKISKEELIKSKFINAIAAISGYVKEAEADVNNDQNYSPEAVYRRMKDIQESFEEDLLNFVRDIEFNISPEQS